MDLGRWREGGISLQLMQQTIASHTPRRSGQKGFAAGFLNGKAYLLDTPKLTGISHHATLFFIYMKALLHLADTFTMPDVVRLL